MDRKLYDSIEDIIGIDITSIYDKELHCPELAIISTLVTAVAMNYLMAFIGASEFGKYSRKKMIDIIKNIRKTKKPNKDLQLETFDEELGELVKAICWKSMDEILDKKEVLKEKHEEMCKSLIEIGISESKSRKMNEKIIDAVCEYIEGVKNER